MEKKKKKKKKRESLDSIVIPDLQPTKSDLRFGYECKSRPCEVVVFLCCFGVDQWHCTASTMFRLSHFSILYIHQNLEISLYEYR